jgi:hypothetical protein
MTISVSKNARLGINGDRLARSQFNLCDLRHVRAMKFDAVDDLALGLTNDGYGVLASASSPFKTAVP